MSVIIKGMDMPSSCANCNGCVNIGVSRYLCVLGDMFIDDDTQIDVDCPLQVLDELPSAEPEIIRCGECRNHGRAVAWCQYSPDDAFCSFAERRTDEAD